MPPPDLPSPEAVSRRPSPPRWWVLFGAMVVAVILAHLLDPFVWQFVRDPRVNDRDWGRMLRSMGYLPVWAVIGAAVGWHDEQAFRVAGTVSSRPFTARGSRGWTLLLVPALAGAVAELAKLLVRRLRPDPEQFMYTFRGYADELLSNRGMGMPSSHVMVAFAGAVVLSRYFPATRALWYLLAIGCAATRILSLGHFLSDTVVGAGLGMIVAWGAMAWQFRSAQHATRRANSA